MTLASLQAPSRIHYPESDGKPIGETDTHISQIIDLRFALTQHFRNNPLAYVAANLLVYYVEGEPREFVVPDVFVVRGVPKGERRVYKLWEEGRVPEIIFEIASASTRREDLGSKRVLYADLGVKEYYVFDPTGKEMRPPLQAFQLAGTDYQPILEPVHSAVLGLDLRVEAGRLRLYDPGAGRFLLTPVEEATAREAAEAEAARLRAELNKLKGQ